MKVFFLFEFATNMLFFVLLGYLVDQYLLPSADPAPIPVNNTGGLISSNRSWGILAGLFIGFFYAFYSLLRRIKNQ